MISREASTQVLGGLSARLLSPGIWEGIWQRICCRQISLDKTLIKARVLILNNISIWKHLLPKM